MNGEMQELNSLSKVLRHDGSYFFIMELGRNQKLYKYIMADWQGKVLGKPIMFYSHTKRSKLSKIDQEYFDNNLINMKRLNKYLKSNLYIGGIKRINNQLVREIKEGINIIPNYNAYLRNNNYILIEKLSDGELKEYNFYEFINKKTIIDFEEENNLYSEKDLLNLKDEKNYVLNNLLNSKRVKEKKKNANGYLGTVDLINGEYRKVYSANTEKNVMNLKR